METNLHTNVFVIPHPTTHQLLVTLTEKLVPAFGEDAPPGTARAMLFITNPLIV